MKVKNRTTNQIVEATKNEDGTYSVEGKTLSREEMGSNYVVVKDKPKKEEEVVVAMREDTQSESIVNLASSFVKANGAMSNGKKNKDGYNYKYMTLDTLADSIRPILLKNGLAVMQTHSLNGNSVSTTTTLIHESGEWMRTTLDIPLSQSKQLSVPQQVGVVCTYSRRYALQAMFMIVAEEDNDGKV